MRLPLFAFLSLSLAPVQGLVSQVPSGTYLYGTTVDWRQPVTPGCGGLFLVDPATPGTPTRITGLPPDVTGCGANLTLVNGAKWVLEDPATGDVFVRGSLENGPISVHRYSIDAANASATPIARYEIGQRALRGGNSDAVLLPDGRLLLVMNPTGILPPGPFAGQVLGIIDPSKKPTTFQSIPVAFNPPLPPNERPNGVALSANGTLAILKVVDSLTYTTRLYSVPFPAGGSATLRATVNIGANKLLREPEGTFLLGGVSSARTESLVRVDLANGTTTVFPQFWRSNWFIGGLGIDPVTDDLLISVGNLTSTSNTSHLYRMRGRTTTSPLARISSGPPGGWGAVFGGFVTTSALHGYGWPTGQPANTRWLLAPNAGGAPTLGNTGFLVQSTAPTGAALGFVVAGFRAGGIAIPVLGVTLWVDNPPVWWPLVPNKTTTTVRLPIPNDPGLSGGEVFLQTFHVDGGGQWSGSSGLRVRVR